MPSLKVDPVSSNGEEPTLQVTPESAGWTYVGFELHRLSPGTTTSGRTGTREVCLVLVTGKARIAARGEDFGVLGGRMSPFEGAPWSCRRVRTGR